VPNSVAEPRLLHSFVAHTGIVKSLIFSPDSKILVSGGLDGIRVWDLVQQRPLFFSYQFTVHTQILDFVINLLFMDTINTNNLGILRTHEQVTEKTNHSRHRGHGEVKF
jgi:WD40 repeat protein